jgi:acetylornithine deacetylase
MDMDQLIVDKISNHVEKNKKEHVDFLSKYVSHDSTNLDLGENAHPTACHEWLSKTLVSYSFFEKVDFWTEDNGHSNVAALTPGENDNSIMICGHTDTVPVTDIQRQEWRSDAGPWSGAVVDGKIWGRGATDMKGGNAAACMAVKTLADLNLLPKNKIILGFVMSEESGNRAYGVDSIVNRGYRAPMCLVPEPTNMDIVHAVQGEFYFRITISGRSTHIAARHLSIYPHGYSTETIPGVNAIDLACSLIRSLKNLETQFGLFAHYPNLDEGSTTINISGISSKGIFSALAEECTITGSMIYSPNISQETATREFMDAVNREVQSNFWLREHPPVVELPYFLAAKPPIDLPTTHVLCKKLSNSMEAIKKNPRFAVTISTSDANYLVDHGIETVTFGPGDFFMGGHGCNEYIPVADYIQAIKVYALTLIQ